MDIEYIIFLKDMSSIQRGSVRSGQARTVGDQTSAEGRQGGVPPAEVEVKGGGGRKGEAEKQKRDGEGGGWGRREEDQRGQKMFNGFFMQHLQVKSVLWVELLSWV